MTKEQLFQICDQQNALAKTFVDRMKKQGMSDVDMQTAFREMFGISMTATEDAPFCAEYSRDKAAYQKAGMSQEEYVHMRRIDAGLDSLSMGAVMPEEKPAGSPSWLASGLREEIFA